MIQDLKDILVEMGFAHRWLEIEKWHTIGKELSNSTAIYDDIPDIATELDIDVEDLWCAILFYKQYPKLENFVSGKDMSWYKLKGEL